MFNSSLCNDMKIGANVGTLGYQCKVQVGTERVKMKLVSNNENNSSDWNILQVIL